MHTILIRSKMQRITPQVTLTYVMIILRSHATKILQEHLELWKRI